MATATVGILLMYYGHIIIIIIDGGLCPHGLWLYTRYIPHRGDIIITYRATIYNMSMLPEMGTKVLGWSITILDVTGHRM